MTWHQGGWRRQREANQEVGSPRKRKEVRVGAEGEEEEKGERKKVAGPGGRGGMLG